VGSVDSSQRVTIQLVTDEKLLSDLIEALRQIQRNGKVGRFGKYLIANFMFMLVLLGIEIDMSSMMMSAMTFWDYNVPLLRVLLVFFVVSFLGPLVIQTLAGGPMEDSAGNAAGGRQVPPRRGGNRSFLDTLTSKIHAYNPHGGAMEPYHWIPGVRFYLIVKESYSLTDVDAIFKVNSLSSFTLGVYQIVGILTTVVQERPINLYVKVNIFSQVLNWGITIAYFATPISKWMGNAANARTLSRHFQGIANYWAEQQAHVRAQVMAVDSCHREETQRRIVSLKKAVADQIVEAFFGGEDEDPERGQVRREARAILSCMRDQDMTELLVLLRDQTMASIDMSGGL